MARKRDSLHSESPALNQARYYAPVTPPLLRQQGRRIKRAQEFKTTQKKPVLKKRGRGQGENKKETPALSYACLFQAIYTRLGLLVTVDHLN